MGLDLLVLPLWRFFAGRYQGPVEAIATRVGSPKPSDPESMARERAGRIREDVERRAGKPLIWDDEGETALSVQHHYGSLQALRAFAAYQEYPQPYRLDGPPEDHPSLLKVYHQNAPTRFPHLIDHSDNSGFYFPVDFDAPLRCVEVVDGPSDRHPLWVRLFGAAALRSIAWALGLGASLAEERRLEKERVRRIRKLRRESPYPPPPKEVLPKAPRGKSLFDWHKVGSSVRLLRELEELNQVLRVPRDSGELASGEGMAEEGDPLGTVKYAWSVLRYAARVSVEKRLPLIFDG